jgi:dolichyl-phosphate beta-glucosyltransferase
MKSLSIIVPLFNKENQIQHTLISINKKCNDLKLDYEIIVVENESTDNSLAKAEEWLSQNNKNAKLYKSQKGLGNAVKKGILQSKNDFITIIPADYTFGESELNYFYHNNASLNEYILGSRALKESYAPTSINRKVITFGFNLLKRLILNLKLKDTQGTFIIKNSLAKNLSNSSISTQFFITTEFVFRALKLGVNIIEIPIKNKINKENESTVYLFSDSFEMFFNLLKLRKLEGKL